MLLEPVVMQRPLLHDIVVAFLISSLGSWKEGRWLLACLPACPFAATFIFIEQSAESMYAKLLLPLHHLIFYNFITPNGRGKAYEWMRWFPCLSFLSFQFTFLFLIFDSVLFCFVLLCGSDRCVFALAKPIPFTTSSCLSSQIIA